MMLRTASALLVGQFPLVHYFRRTPLATRGIESDFFSLGCFESDDVAAITSVAIRRDGHFDFFAGLDHPVAVTGAVNVVAAMRLEFNLTLTLGIAHFD